MSASETSICNAALTLLGERAINSLDDQTKVGRIMNEVYPDKREELLRNHSWNFATARASLAASLTPPVWGFDYSYPLPSDCLRILNVNDVEDIGWRIEGREVVTNIAAPLEIEYTRDITDPTEMDVLFRQVLSTLIARDTAETITGSVEKAEEMERLYRQRLSPAKAVDGQEPSRRHIESSSFLDAREEGSW